MLVNKTQGAIPTEEEEPDIEVAHAQPASPEELYVIAATRKGGQGTENHQHPRDVGTTSSDHQRVVKEADNTTTTDSDAIGVQTTSQPASPSSHGMHEETILEADDSVTNGDDDLCIGGVPSEEELPIFTKGGDTGQAEGTTVKKSSSPSSHQMSITQEGGKTPHDVHQHAKNLVRYPRTCEMFDIFSTNFRSEVGKSAGANESPCWEGRKTGHGSHDLQEEATNLVQYPLCHQFGVLKHAKNLVRCPQSHNPSATTVVGGFRRLGDDGNTKTSAASSSESNTNTIGSNGQTADASCRSAEGNGCGGSSSGRETSLAKLKDATGREPRSEFPTTCEMFSANFHREVGKLASSNESPCWEGKKKRGSSHDLLEEAKDLVRYPLCNQLFVLQQAKNLVRYPQSHQYSATAEVGGIRSLGHYGNAKTNAASSSESDTTKSSSNGQTADDPCRSAEGNGSDGSHDLLEEAKDLDRYPLCRQLFVLQQAKNLVRCPQSHQPRAAAVVSGFRRLGHDGNAKTSSASSSEYGTTTNCRNGQTADSPCRSAEGNGCGGSSSGRETSLAKLKDATGREPRSEFPKTSEMFSAYFHREVGKAAGANKSPCWEGRKTGLGSHDLLEEAKNLVRYPLCHKAGAQAVSGAGEKNEILAVVPPQPGDTRRNIRILQEAKNLVQYPRCHHAGTLAIDTANTSSSSSNIEVAAEAQSMFKDKHNGPSQGGGFCLDQLKREAKAQDRAVKLAQRERAVYLEHKNMKERLRERDGGGFVPPPTEEEECNGLDLNALARNSSLDNSINNYSKIDGPTPNQDQDQDQEPLRDNDRRQDDHEAWHMQNSETHLVRASLVEPPVMAEIVHQALSTPAETPPPDAASSGRKHFCCTTAAAFLACLTSLWQA